MSVEITRRRFSVGDYHRMAEVGILSEEDRVELIDGEIVRMSPIGLRHQASVDRAARSLFRAVGDDAIVRVQGSARLDLYSEPEPDLLLLRFRDDFYSSRPAGPEDVLLVVEVADTSLAYDRSVKASLYVRSGISDYWILNLVDEVLDVRRTAIGGEFRDCTVHGPAESVRPLALPGIEIPVRAWLG
jgi:Uma2 family endonuclease